MYYFFALSSSSYCIKI